MRSRRPRGALCYNWRNRAGHAGDQVGGGDMITAASKRVLEFTQRNYLAILATVYPSGGPQAFPVWYDYDGECFTIATDASAAKVRNVAHNPKVALCITDTTRYVRSLTVMGTAQVLPDASQAQMLHRRVSIRYLGEDEGAQWADSMDEDQMCVLRIDPERYLWTG